MAVKRITKTEVKTPKAKLKIDFSKCSEPTDELIKKVRELTEKGAILKDMSGQLGIPLERLKRWLKRGEKEEGYSSYALLYGAYCEARSALSIKLFESTIELAKAKCDSRTMLELYNQVCKRDELKDDEGAKPKDSKFSEIMKQIK